MPSSGPWAFLEGLRTVVPPKDASSNCVWVGEGGTHGGEWKDDEDPSEVWWALRGAGPALGVITRFRAKAYYLPSVFAGNLI